MNPIDNVYEEGQFIKQNLEQQQRQLYPFKPLSTQTHKCNPKCKWETLNKGNCFYRQGVKFLSTGMVFVCSSSLNIHICGYSNCFNYVLSPNGEGAICCITGMWLGEEYAMNTNWYDPDVRSAGSISYTHKIDHVVEGKLNKISELSGVVQSSSNNDDEDPDGFLANSKNFFKDAANAQLLLDNKSTKSHTLKGSTANRKKKSFDETMLSIGSAMDIQRISIKYNHLSEQQQLAQLQARVKRKNVIETVWITFTVSQYYIEEAKKVLNAASEKWYGICKNYVKDCQTNGIAHNYFKLLMFWLTYVGPHMKNVIHGDQIVKTNNEFKEYYIECVLRIWELLDDVQLIKTNRVTFAACAPALLTKLSQGLTQTVYVLPGDPKPRIKDTFNEHLLINATSVDIEFIPPHPNLILATTSEVRKQSPIIANEEKKRKKGLITPTKQADLRLSGCNSRRNRKPVGIITSTKCLNNIYRSIIENASCIEDLEKRKFVYD